jgi:hypothetical protein
VVLSHTGSINLGFTTEGKLAVVLIITLLLGFSNKFSGVNYTPANNNQGVTMHEGFIDAQEHLDPRS